MTAKTKAYASFIVKREEWI